MRTVLQRRRAWFAVRDLRRRDAATAPSCASSRIPRRIAAFERTKEFRGRYHVLQGALNPLEGIGPEQLRVEELVSRIDTEGITEIVLCTNPNLEGEATAMYLARRLSGLAGPGDPAGQRAAGRRRPRVRGRDDPRPGPRGPARATRLGHGERSLPVAAPARQDGSPTRRSAAGDHERTLAPRGRRDADALGPAARRRRRPPGPEPRRDARARLVLDGRPDRRDHRAGAGRAWPSRRR